MFKPLPMQRLSLWVMREDLCVASQQLAAQQSFNPDRASPAEEALPESPGERYRELYLSARTRFAKIMEHCGELPAEDLVSAPQPVSLEELVSVNDFLGELWQVCFQEQDRLRREEDNARRIAGLLQTLDRLAALDLDLSILARPKRLLELKLGTLPPASLPRLGQALALSGFVLSVFSPGEDVVHTAIAGPTGREEEIAALLRAAGWRDMEVPAELMTHPEKARKDLELAAARADEAVAAQCRLIDDKRESYRNRILHARRALTHAGPFATVSGEALRARGEIALITGWVPRQDGELVRAALAARLPGRHLLELRDPKPAELAQVPSFTRYPRWLSPFAELVRLYGTPRYGEIDPTLLFAFAYVLMFGLMFGDVGQGALLAIAGFFLQGALRPYRPFVVAIGLSSTLFGFAYGSVFTLETILHPLWMSPLENPGRMLELAIQFGIGFILLTSVISVYNHWIEGKLHHALYDASGIAGLVFYVAAAWWADGWMRRGEHGTAAVLVALAALAVVLGFKWHEAEGRRGEKALIAGIEGFETAMGFFANTLSFLRVSAFALNHVALALAVLTIAEGMGSFGHWLTIVIGNVVIFVLEGAIVAIQALRLNYYEGFSRFYRGDGRRYRPLSFSVPAAGGGEQAGP